MWFGTSAVRSAAATTLPLVAAMHGQSGRPVWLQTVETASIDLSGVYTDMQVCDFRDDTGGSQPYPGNVDFSGTLVHGVLTGTINVCHWERVKGARTICVMQFGAGLPITAMRDS